MSLGAKPKLYDLVRFHYYVPSNTLHIFMQEKSRNVETRCPSLLSFYVLLLEG